MDSEVPARARRLTTGDAGLDTILHGGLFRGSVTLVQGSPGAGKTVLANQMAFAHAREGGSVLYLTLLAESHSRLISHIGQLDFFSRDDVANAIHYLSAYAVLVDEGVKGVLRLIGSEARSHNASLVILDGLFTLEETIEESREFRKFINDLAVQAELMACTMLLLTNGKRLPTSPEFTMVDGWIELGRQPLAYQSVRYLEAHKLRGSDFISGRHFLTISDAGLQVLPRLESTMGQRVPSSDLQPPYIGTGMPQLDDLVGGGLCTASTTLLVGPPGIGKTTMGMHFLALSDERSPGLLFGFYEDRGRLQRQAEARGIDLASVLARGNLDLLWWPPTENLIDVLGYQLIENVKRRGVRRLVIDGVNAFTQSAAYPERIGRFLSALVNELRCLGCTTLLTAESPSLTGSDDTLFTSFSAIAENAVLLRYAEQDGAMHRLLNVIKVRERGFDPRTFEFVIGPGGFRLGDVFRRQAAPRPRG
jgi:circadian clock protein KaiC